jgi:protein TonB
MRKDYFELNYPLRIRVVFISVMFFLISVFYFFPRIIESKSIIEEAEYTEILKVELITIIQQQQKFESARPAIPIEADEDSEIDTLDFMDTDVDGFDLWSAPPANKKKRRKFIEFDKWPSSKGVLSPRYPDICKTAGIEGRVVIEFYINEAGKVDQSSVTVLNSIPCLDQVCVDEIKKSKWRPARQGKEKVGVYLTKTFNFTLEQAN